MAYTILQTVTRDGTPIFKTNDIIKISTTVTADIVGRVNTIKQSGADYVINLDLSTEYNAASVDVSLSSITSAEVITK